MCSPRTDRNDEQLDNGQINESDIKAEHKSDELSSLKELSINVHKYAQRLTKMLSITLTLLFVGTAMGGFGKSSCVHWIAYCFSITVNPGCNIDVLPTSACQKRINAIKKLSTFDPNVPSKAIAGNVCTAAAKDGGFFRFLFCCQSCKNFCELQCDERT